MTVSSEKTATVDSRAIKGYARKIRESSKIDPALYQQYNVKRGLRNSDGTGVLTGLTSIGSVHGYVTSESEKVSVPGQLFYRGINVRDFVKGFQSSNRFGFEECAYLLLLGDLPTNAELDEWCATLGQFRHLPAKFRDDSIIRVAGTDIMNGIARAVLAAYTQDPAPDKIDIATTLRQSICMVAQFPTIAAYAWQAKRHAFGGKKLIIHEPDEKLGTAENFLRMIRDDGKYTELEAELFDLCLVLHAEHGGGNNSSFTTHVVTSTYTDAYSAIAAAVLSLKGPRHGGANLRVMTQMQEIKKNVRHWYKEGEVADYLRKILDKEAGDGTGLIYGLGHAVYTLSDPRTEILRERARLLARANKREEEMELYETIERVGPEVFNERRSKPRDLCANVDFYSGFVYDMLGISLDLYTPIFAISRVVGWCAHRIEELLNGGPIIRPAYKAIVEHRPYVPYSQR